MQATRPSRSALGRHVQIGLFPAPTADFPISRVIRDELEAHDPALLDKPMLVVFNKMDLPAARESWPAFEKAARTAGRTVVAADQDGQGALTATRSFRVVDGTVMLCAENDVVSEAPLDGDPAYDCKPASLPAVVDCDDAALSEIDLIGTCEAVRAPAGPLPASLVPGRIGLRQHVTPLAAATSMEP